MGGHSHFHFPAFRRRQAHHRLTGRDEFIPLNQQGFYPAGKRSPQRAFFEQLGCLRQGRPRRCHAGFQGVPTGRKLLQGLLRHNTTLMQTTGALPLPLGLLILRPQLFQPGPGRITGRLQAGIVDTGENITGLHCLTQLHRPLLQVTAHLECQGRALSGANNAREPQRHVLAFTTGHV